MSGDKQTQQIKDELATFASQYGPAAVLPATVKAINDDDTIQIELSDGSVIDDCRLKSVVASGNKVLLIPTVNSVVLVARIQSSDEFVLLSVHEISEFKVIVGDKTYSLTSEGFLIKAGDDTLKEILTLLADAMNVIVVLSGNNPDYAKIAQAKTKIQNLLR